MVRSSLKISTLAAVLIIAPACVGMPKQEAPSVVIPQPGTSGPDMAGSMDVVPAENARIIYVSDSHGNDDTGRIYFVDDPEIGANPRHPVGPIKAFKTFTAAYRHVREGEPDWILVKRGDTFYGSSASLGSLSPDHSFIARATAHPATVKLKVK